MQGRTDTAWLASVITDGAFCVISYSFIFPLYLALGNGFGNKGTTDLTHGLLPPRNMRWRIFNPYILVMDPAS